MDLFWKKNNGMIISKKLFFKTFKLYLYVYVVPIM